MNRKNRKKTVQKNGNDAKNFGDELDVSSIALREKYSLVEEKIKGVLVGRGVSLSGQKGRVFVAKRYYTKSMAGKSRRE
jgi:hypothetical protein